jgi:hypothetical protein
LTGQPYKALTNVHFLLQEGALLAERLLAGDRWPDLRTEAREGRLFGSNRPASQLTILTPLKSRLEDQTPEVWRLLSQGTLEARQVLTLALNLQQHRLLREFIAQELVPRMRIFEKRLTDADVRRFLSHLADQAPEVAAWSAATVQKTRGSITRFLQDAGLLQETGRGQYELLPIHLAPSVRSLLDEQFPEELRLLEALK